MERWMLAAFLLATAGCAPGPSTRAPSADLGAWVDAAESRQGARSTTLHAATIPETAPGTVPAERWRPLTIAAREAAPPRPQRRPPVDVSFQHSDMVSAFQLLADAGRFNVVMSEGLGGHVTATLRGIDPYDALKAMAEANGVEVRYDGQVVLLRKR